ncbi:hypothetical protein AB4Y67_09740 [Arthrobacter sp. YAF17]|uniref:hypothetical protein n=1 Tax=Arthrobacter sp. YAF17 TaxID=3233077 RepID=UPI003F93239C
MNSLFFWIIILSFLIPMAMRYYKKSMRGRNQNQGMPGGPDQFGQFPGGPDQFGQFPGGQSGYGPGPYPGQQNKQPRDGMTQRDYFGAFGELGAPRQPMPPANQQYPNQQYPGQYPVPYEDSPDYPGNQPRPFPQQDAGQFGAPQFGTQQSSTPPPSGPAVPPPPSAAAPQGFRARKLAELDQRYSDGDLAMEDYMAQRAEIMKG